MESFDDFDPLETISSESEANYFIIYLKKYLVKNLIDFKELSDDEESEEDRDQSEEDQDQSEEDQDQSASKSAPSTSTRSTSARSDTASKKLGGSVV